MTVTETRPESSPQTAPSDAVDPRDQRGFADALATGDHKVLGRMYLFFGLAGGLLALVLNLLVALERLDIGGVDILTFGSDNQFFQAWSLSRTSLLLFCVVPLLLGLATYIVPLQVGAPSIAFPRAAAAAFWTWLVGMGIHVATVFVDGGLGYPLNPVAAAQGTDPEAIELALLSIGMVVVAVLLASVCIMTTIIAERPEGMSLYEVPVFSWSMLVAGGIWLLALPVWLANVAIAWVDFGGEDAQRYGNVANIWEQVSWLWSQPMVFAFAIPVLGIVGEIIPVSARKSQRFYGTQQVAIGAFGVLAFGAWAQPAFNPQVSEQVLFAAVGVLLIVPLLVFAGGLADTLAKSKPALSAHFVLALFSLIALLVGAAVAALHVSGAAIGVVREIDDGWLQELIEPLEDLRGTVIATGVMQHALLAAVMGAVAGLYYWAPKIFGRRLSGPTGVLAGLALLGGTLLSGTANVINGFLDEGDDVFRPGAYRGVWDADAVELFNVIGFVGAILALLGLSLVVLDIVVSIGFGKGSDEDANDPWGGHTLEWATTSPPPVGNFEQPPVLNFGRPLSDSQEEA